MSTPHIDSMDTSAIDRIFYRHWLLSAVMKRLASSFNVRSLLAAGAIGLLSFAVIFVYRAVNIRQRMIKLRKDGLV